MQPNLDPAPLLENWRGIFARIQSFSPRIVAGASHVPQIMPILNEHELVPDYYLDLEDETAAESVCGLDSIKLEALNKLAKSAGVCVCNLGGVELADRVSKHGDIPILDLFLPLGHTQFASHFDPRIIADNLNTIQTARELFSDTASRDLFDRLIAFRLTYDLRLIPLPNIPLYHHPATAPRAGDVVIDAGAYDGDTALDFAATTNRRLKIYSFEPDRTNLAALRNTLKRSEMEGVVEAIPMALWRENGHVQFSGSNSSARIEDQGDRLLPATTLDSFCESRGVKPTLIKTDLEGADIEALRGAQKTIATHRPRLALSVYHCADDLWEIPLLVDQLRPNSKFYLVRHQGPEALAEIVCYVV